MKSSNIYLTNGHSDPGQQDVDGPWPYISTYHLNQTHKDSRSRCQTSESYSEDLETK